MPGNPRILTVAYPWVAGLVQQSAAKAIMASSGVPPSRIWLFGKWCAELPYCLFGGRLYQPVKWMMRIGLENRILRRSGKLDKVFGQTRLPILHSSSVGFTCQRSGFDQASDQELDTWQPAAGWVVRHI